MIHISRNQLLFAFSKSLDLVESNVGRHHYQVGFITYLLSLNLGLEAKECQEHVTGALLHDIGILSSETYKDLKNYEFESLSHTYEGAKIIKSLPFYGAYASVVEHHHTPYNKRDLVDIPLASRVIFLADRISVILCEDSIDKQMVERLKNKILLDFGTKYDPILKDAFLKLLNQSIFWDFHNTRRMIEVVKSAFQSDEMVKDYKTLKELLMVFQLITDYKSPFTAFHCTTVAQVAKVLACGLGLSAHEIDAIECAGMVHDIGKLAIPSRVLEKPGRLDPEEYTHIKKHVYYSKIVLEDIEGFEVISEIACNHHEKLNGSGYPDGKTSSQLCFSSRILACADIFSALIEPRPYKQSMTLKQILLIMKGMVNAGEIDPIVFGYIEDNGYYLENFVASIGKKSFENMTQIPVVPVQLTKRLDTV